MSLVVGAVIYPGYWVQDFYDAEGDWNGSWWVDCPNLARLSEADETRTAREQDR